MLPTTFRNNAILVTLLSGLFATLSEAGIFSPSSNHGKRPGGIFRSRSANAKLPVSAPWQIVLRRVVATPLNALAIVPQTAVIWDIDLADSSPQLIAALKRAKKTVICYFSAGSSETWRSDYGQFVSADIGQPLQGWEGENWIDTRSTNVRNIMKARIALAKSKGCDAIDPDNMDGYATNSGFPLSQDTAVDYMRFLSSEARKNGLLIGLKNAGQIVPQVLSMTDFAVNEQCVQFVECVKWAPYIKAGKPVLHIEYPDSAPLVSKQDLATKCSRKGDAAGSDGFSTVLETYDLDGQVTYCDGSRYATPVEGLE